MNRTCLLAGAIGLTLLSANPSYAGYAMVPALLAITDNVQIVLEDDVTGGCLPQPESAKKALQLELLRSGMRLSDTNSPEYIYVYMNGFLIDGSLCVVSYELTIRTWVYAEVSYATGEDRTFIPIIIYKDGGVYSAGKYNAQKSAEESLEELGKNLSVEWLKLRQSN